MKAKKTQQQTLTYIQREGWFISSPNHSKISKMYDPCLLLASIAHDMQYQHSNS